MRMEKGDAEDDGEAGDEEDGEAGNEEEGGGGCRRGWL